jgi:hypothetical protein
VSLDRSLCSSGVGKRNPRKEWFIEGDMIDEGEPGREEVEITGEERGNVK